MATEYVSQVILEVNGQQIDDFQSVTEKEVETRKAIQLMSKWGFVSVPPLFGIDLDYVIPSDAPEFDFTTVANGTLTIDRENGVRIQFGNVYFLKYGDSKYEGGKETIKSISLAALRRTV